MLVHIVLNRQFFGIPFTFISSLYNYYHPLDVLTAVTCVEFCIVSTVEVFPKFLLIISFIIVKTANERK